jgi:hypothetical protein
MQRIKNKQPIHINIHQRGKLRKVVRERHSLPLEEASSLVLTPRHVVEDCLQFKHRHTFYLRKFDIKNKKIIQVQP